MPKSLAPSTDPKHPDRRTRQDRVVQVRMTDALYQALHSVAAETGRSLPATIRERLEATTLNAA